MAVSSADSGRRLSPARGWLLFISCCSVAVVAHGAGPNRADLQPIEVVAASSDIDLRENTATLRQVTITQGTVKVRANEAHVTGGVEDFQNNRWVLQGDVRITLDGGSLRADEAEVRFADNRIVNAVIKGSPACFQQKLENNEGTARGRAQQIDYDVEAETVRLQRDAFLTDERNNITGQKLVYSIRDQRVLADASDQGDERVHITINPRTPQLPPKETVDPCPR
jgi:lipopolysaccharide export system protein LptA